MNRREMLKRFTAGAAAAGVTAEAIEAALDAASLGATDPRLMRVVTHADPAILCRALIECAAGGEFTLADFVARVRRYENRECRARKRAERQSRHAGNEVLYRGPVQVWQDIASGGRRVYSAARHRVIVGVADREYAITGIGLPRPDDPVVVRDEDTGHPVGVEGPRTRSVTIPAGSRILIDMRHGLRPIMACEVVRTAGGRIRLHLWSGAAARSDDPTTPRLSGGVVCETGSQRAVGLLGLPL